VRTRAVAAGPSRINGVRQVAVTFPVTPSTYHAVEAEARLRLLEIKARYHEDRADRAEKWLYRISVEIEQKFLAGDENNSQPPQVVSQSQRG
jgi:hypothetical protein